MFSYSLSLKPAGYHLLDPCILMASAAGWGGVGLRKELDEPAPRQGTRERCQWYDWAPCHQRAAEGFLDAVRLPLGGRSQCLQRPPLAVEYAIFGFK